MVRSSQRLEAVDWMGKDPGAAIAAAGGRPLRRGAITTPARNIRVDSWALR
jgi:hypothetical protein